MADLDPALVEQTAKVEYDWHIAEYGHIWSPGSPSLLPWDKQAEHVKNAYRKRTRALLLSLDIPAAALNALAKGEAVVVPKEPNAAIVQAGYYAVGVLYRAMLAASPYAEE